MVTMGDYGWSIDFDTSQGIVAVEYGRVLEYPKRERRSMSLSSKYFDTLIYMILDTARTNTPAGYPVRRSATSAWPLCICSFGHRALRASSIVFLSSLSFRFSVFAISIP